MLRRAAVVSVLLLMSGLVTVPSAGALAPVDPPTNVVAVAADASASVTWVPPVNDGGSTITSYTVTTTGTNAPAAKLTGAVTTTIVTGLTNGESYSFTVVAHNADGDSPVSASSNTVVPLGVPAAPASVAATPLNASASVTWSAPADDGGSPITGYTITTTGTGAPGPISVSAVTTSQIVDRKSVV